MKNLKVNLAILVALLFVGSTTVFGQQESDDKHKKVVIITKTVDENGKETTKKIVKEISGDEVIMMNHEGKLHEMMKIDVDADTDGENKMKIKIAKGEGDAAVFEWIGDGEVPDEILRELEEKGISMEVDENHNVFHFSTDNDANSACLGVVIGHKENIENINGNETIITEGTSELGVPVLDVIANSGAQDAGIIEDDIITAINGAEVASINDVIELLAPFEAGANVAVAYLRDGQGHQTTAVLQTCGNVQIEEIEEEIEWTEEGEEDTNIRRVIIKKQKGGTPEIVEETELDDDTEDFDFVQEGTQTLDLENIDIFPNPNEGVFTLKFEAPAVATIIKVTSIDGKEIYQETLKDFNGIYSKEINLNNASKGTLILSIYQENRVFSEKIILQK